MDRLIISYALIKNCWHAGHEYLDCFCPFILNVMPANQTPRDLQGIKDLVNSKYDLDVPLHTLGIIMRRLKANKCVDIDVDKNRKSRPLHERYLLTEEGLRHQQSAELESEVERRIAALHVDIRQFILEKHNWVVSEEDIKTSLLSLLKKNTAPLVEYFNPTDTPRHLNVSNIISKLGNYIVDYIEVADREKPAHYTTLHDLLLGAILCTVLNVQDLRKITEPRHNKCTLYLDSNFMLSALGLHEEVFNDSASELIALAKNKNFKLSIFNFTVNEICRVLNGYLTEGEKYPQNIKIENSIYSNLKRKGWTKVDTRNFISSIEDKIRSMGIELDVENDIDIDSYVVDTSRRLAMSAYKMDQPRPSQNHDFAAIDTIKRIRRHSIRKLSNTNAFFLTSDTRLSAYDFERMGHKQDGTIAEVMLDSLLTNIIWLNDPGANVSLKSIVALHSHGLFIKREIWLKFYDALVKARQQDKIDDQDISNLFYANFIEEQLLNESTSSAALINEQYVTDMVEKAKRSATADKETREADLVRQLTVVRSQTEVEKDRRFSSTLETIKKNVLKSASRTGNWVSIIICLLLSAILILTCWLCDVLHITWIIPIVVNIAGLTFIWTKVRNSLKRSITFWAYTNKLKEIGWPEDDAQVNPQGS